MRRLAALIFVCLISVCSFAQGTNASITGFIQDPSKAFISGVSVVAINIATNERTTAKTDRSGSYNLPSLPAGSYRMEVEKQGFKTILKENLDLHVQSALEVNFQMAIGSTSESITITDSTADIQTNGAVSTVIDRAMIENAPLNGNNLSTLFELTPGVVTNVAGNPGLGGGFSVNGQRPTSNYLTIDGANGNIFVPGNNGQSNVSGATIGTSASGGTNGLLPVDAVEEYRMQTSTYSPEYGRTPGGQIEIKTRSGTNELHGTLFENFRNQIFDATDWFTKHNHLTQTPLRFNDFGGTLGGAAIRNRLFYFLAHETLLMRQPQPAVTIYVPNEAIRASAASVYQPYLNAYPKGNMGACTSSSCEGVSDTYVYTYSNQIADHSTSLRMDLVLPNQVRLFARGNYAPSSFATPNLAGITSRANISTGTIGLIYPIKPHIVSETTLNLSKNISGYSYLTPELNGSQVTPFTNAANQLVNLQKSMIVFQPTTLAWTNLYAGPNTKTSLAVWNLVSSITWDVDKHVVKGGIDFLPRRPSIANFADQVYVEPATASLQTGNVDDLQVNATNGKANIKFVDFSAYAEDVWKVTPSLSLNYGFRWEYNPAPTATAPGLLALTGSPATPSTFGVRLTTDRVYNTSFTNFAPRFGTAYTLPGSRYHRVIRAGAGLFYDTGQAATVAQAAAISYPYTSTITVTNVPYNSIDISAINATASVLPQRTLYLNTPDLHSPRTIQWSVTLDQELPWKSTLSVSYVGNDGNQLIKEDAYSGLTPTLATLFYLNTNGAASNYEALQVQVRSSMQYLSAIASYSYAHARDSGSSDFVSQAGLSTQGLRNSDYDVRNIFSSLVTVRSKPVSDNKIVRGVTSGWSLDSITLLESALPLSVISNNTNLNLYNGFANIVPGEPTVIHDPTAPGGKRLNPAAFASNPGTSDGSSVRNGYRLFGLTQWDVSLGRTFKLTEHVGLIFKATAFNVINLANFGSVYNSISSANLNPQFGEATKTYASAYGNSGTALSATYGPQNTVFTNGGPRDIEFSAKIKF